MNDSQIRAFISQTFVKKLESLPAEDAAPILAAVDGEARTRLGQLTSLAWAPLSLHLALLDAALERLGPERLRPFLLRADGGGAAPSSSTRRFDSSV